MAGQPVQPSQGQAAVATQQQQAKWPAGGANATAVSSEQLSLELHQVEREIGKRTREMAMVSKGVSSESVTVKMWIITITMGVQVLHKSIKIGIFFNNVDTVSTFCLFLKPGKPSSP